MNIDDLKAAIVPWLRIDTWHTPHPLDDQRFHRSLKSAFDSLGTSIALDDFRVVMTQLAQEHHPNMQASDRKVFVEEFAQRAKNISRYLHDNSI